MRRRRVLGVSPSCPAAIRGNVPLELNRTTAARRDVSKNAVKSSLCTTCLYAPTHPLKAYTRANLPPGALAPFGHLGVSFPTRPPPRSNVCVYDVPLRYGSISMRTLTPRDPITYVLPPPTP